MHYTSIVRDREIKYIPRRGAQTYINAYKLHVCHNRIRTSYLYVTPKKSAQSYLCIY